MEVLEARLRRHSELRTAWSFQHTRYVCPLRDKRVGRENRPGTAAHWSDIFPEGLGDWSATLESGKMRCMCDYTGGRIERRCAFLL